MTKAELLMAIEDAPMDTPVYVMTVDGASCDPFSVEYETADGSSRDQDMICIILPPAVELVEEDE
jgi:hypothetical protein